ncbi:hypothetical protein [Paenibacillus campi]|uniref:hypothetical protein n=1 Tax=Paenibacillus campi TaxID=3106031 RepID=UPI002B000EB2|nr:hypothetical protein [Paenibacillus sp. SGZ-1014]
MNRLQHWRHIAPVMIVSALLLGGCGMLGNSVSTEQSQLARKGGDHLSVIKLTPHKQARLQTVQEYPLPPEQLPGNIAAGNYELIYSQTSDRFKREVSWDAFLDTLQAFSGDGSTYTLSSSKREQSKLRQLWTNTKHNKGIVVVFAEQHPKYPDHTILAMRVGNLTLAGDNIQ